MTGDYKSSVTYVNEPFSSEIFVSSPFSHHSERRFISLKGGTAFS